MSTVTLTIDGKSVTVPKGTTILEAAKTVGIEIPNYCYHPGLSISGNCRICLVEVEKMPKLTTGCSTTCGEGMVVHTDNERVVEARRGVLELMLTNHPIDCPVCDQAGECKLQDYYMLHGLHKSHFVYEKTHKPKVVELPPHLMFDGERCILCSRCVRFCEEVTKTNDLAIINRGTHAEIDTFHHEGIDNGYAGNLHEICPVGALLSKDFRFKKRVWWLKPHKSVCPHCSTGCNIYIDESDGEVFRFRSRENLAVNRYWLCDEGRYAYKFINADNRLTAPFTRMNGERKAVDWNEALQLVHDRLIAAGKSGTVAGLASNGLTNEELFLFGRYVNLLGATVIDGRHDDSHTRTTEREDEILKRADKNPNSNGVKLLGLVGDKDVRGILEDAAAGKIKALYVLDAQRYEALGLADLLRKAAAKAEFVVMHATHDVPVLDAAHVVLAGATFAEKAGTFTNYEGRVQKIARSLRPKGNARADWEILAGLLAKTGANAPPIAAASDAFLWMAKSVPAFAGLAFSRIPDDGIVVAG